MDTSIKAMTMQQVIDALDMQPGCCAVWDQATRTVAFTASWGGRTLLTPQEAREMLAEMAAMLPAGLAPGSVIGTRGAFCERCADDNALGIDSPNHAAH